MDARLYFVALFQPQFFRALYLLPRLGRAVNTPERRPFFFFQAEDGIRDIGVTGVQTCALPISDGNCRVSYLKAGVRLLTKRRSIMMRNIVTGLAAAAIATAASTFSASAIHGGFGGDRKSVVEGKRVDLGGRRIIKKKRIVY